MKRRSSTAAVTARLVEPTSVTTAPRGAADRVSRTAADSRATGAATKTASASPTASAGEPAAASSAPRSIAVEVTPSAGSNPVTCAPARSRAARAMEPPMSPTPTTATRTSRTLSDRRQALAGERRRLLDLGRVLGEALGEQRLRAVADRLGRVRVHLDDDAVGAHGGRRERQRLHERAPPGGVARVHDDRQVGELLEDRHGGEVEREAVRRLERPDAALA